MWREVCACACMCLHGACMCRCCSSCCCSWCSESFDTLYTKPETIVYNQCPAFVQQCSFLRFEPGILEVVIVAGNSVVLSTVYSKYSLSGHFPFTVMCFLTLDCLTLGKPGLERYLLHPHKEAVVKMKFLINKVSLGELEGS